ncbi:MAG: universal stress protein [Anaerolineaceae bacterium]|nr:universal stress protein [Anaerolineaceae bacterium]
MFTHLLVPLDGSELAEIALPMAWSVAEKFKSKITLLRVVHLPYYIGDGLDITDLYTSLDQKMQQEARAYLEEKRKVLRGAGIEVNLHLVVGEPPADAILLAVDELGVDAIVMSTHGRGGMMRWVFGSVADRVLQRARVPILLSRVTPPGVNPVQPPTAEAAEDIRSHEEPARLTGNGH